VSTKLNREWKNKLSREVRTVMRKAIRDAVDMEFTADVVDEWLQEFLKGKCCYLSFNEGVPDILIGLGHGDVAESFTPELSLDDYSGSGGLRRPEQLRDVLEQMVGIQKFIVQLEDGRRKLEAVVEAYKKRQP
jgi:hypothetical protein